MAFDLAGMPSSVHSPGVQAFLPINIPASGQVFLAGCLGAISPEICRIYRARSRINSIVFSVRYFSISTMYMVLGGFVALFLAAGTLRAAFYVGCSLDVIVSAATRPKPRKGAKEIALNRMPTRAEEFVNFVRQHADDLFN